MKVMPKGAQDNSLPLGICHRIINCIMNNFICQSFKRVTALERAASVEVPVEDSSRNLKNPVWPSNTKGHGALGPEIAIAFRHIEGPENSTDVQKLDSPVTFPKRNAGLNVRDDHRSLLQQEKGVKGKGRRHSEGATSSSVVPPLEQTDATVRINGPQEWEYPAATWGRGPKSKIEKYENKKKNIDTETTSGNENEERKKKPQSHPKPPDMLSNINEDAEAFITSRLEAMGKQHRSEPKKF